MSGKWQAQWIWASGQEEAVNLFAEARRKFQLPGQAKRAVVRVTANQFYTMTINGREIGRGPAPSDNKWKYYDEYDVTAALQAGDNVIAVTAYNFGKEPIVTHQLQGPGGLLVQLDASYEGAEGAAEMTIISDSSWKCRKSPRWVPATSRQHQWRGFREIYLAAEEDGWEDVQYDDSMWPDAVMVAKAEQADSPWPRLLPRDIPQLQESMRSPLAVIASEPYLGRIDGADALIAGSDNGGRAMIADASVPGSYPQVTYDFGREVVGYPQLEVEAPEGGVLQLFYGETLEMELTDTFMLKKGRNRLAPFARRAFRYMKLAVQATPQPIYVEKVQLRFVHYPFPQQGSFHCSDEKLDRIWETGKYTTIVNSQDHFEDCPHREQALWVADAVVMAKVVYQAFGDAAIVRKSLLQSARIQHDDGSIAGTGPEANPFLLPDFCAHWLFGVHEYWQYSGDRAFLQEVWPHVLKLAEWFAAQEDAHGLFEKADRDGWWCFIDWTQDIERKDRVTVISCFYYKFLLLTAELALELGEKELAAELQDKAVRLRLTIRTRMRAEGSELFADCLTDEGLSRSITAQTNFAAAWTGVMTEEEAKRFIADIYLADKLPRIRGAFFYHIVLETLFRHGFADAAIEQIRRYWGAMLDRGATTWWETFDPGLPFCTIPSPYQGHTPTYLRDEVPVSLSHGWGASPTNLLLSDVLGIDVRHLGTGGEGDSKSAQVLLKPLAAGGLTWAKGVVPTAAGDIEAEWEQAGEAQGKFRFAVVLPADLQWKTEGLQELTVEELGSQVRVAGTF